MPSVLTELVPTERGHRGLLSVPTRHQPWPQAVTHLTQVPNSKDQGYTTDKGLYYSQSSDSSVNYMSSRGQRVGKDLCDRLKRQRSVMDSHGTTHIVCTPVAPLSTRLPVSAQLTGQTTTPQGSRLNKATVIHLPKCCVKIPERTLPARIPAIPYQ